MELFKNLIYEYKKGMRDLALYTCESDLVEEFIVILEKMKIQYLSWNCPEIFKQRTFKIIAIRRFYSWNNAWIFPKWAISQSFIKNLTFISYKWRIFVNILSKSISWWRILKKACLLLITRLLGYWNSSILRNIKLSLDYLQK